MIVMKFGGTSVAGCEEIAQVARIVSAETRPRTVVVSAMAGVTDRLVALARSAASGDGPVVRQELSELRSRHADAAAAVCRAERLARLQAALDTVFSELETITGAIAILRHAPPPLTDAVLAAGELLSSRIVAAALGEAGVPATWVDARHLVVTDGTHGRAVASRTATERAVTRAVAPLLARGQVPVTAGFIGATSSGVTTTLGRGGSDYSASLIGACAGAREIQIWTDVDGMLTADPRVVDRPRLVARLSFAEATELARFGAKVLHPSTIRPAVRASIPVRIRNTFRPHAPGTIITASASPCSSIAALACRSDVALIGLSPAPGRDYAVAARLFSALDKAGVEPHITLATESHISVAVRESDHLAPALERLRRWTCISIETGLAAICAVGEALRRESRPVSAMLASLDGVPLRLVAHPPAGRHVALMVPQAHLRAAMTRLHETMFGAEVSSQWGRILKHSVFHVERGQTPKQEGGSHLET
jgi:aspartate kinase